MSTARLTILAGATACGLALAGCVNRFEDHSAYKDVPFLCGDGADPDAFEPELEARIDACRAAGTGACSGVFNMTGTLENTYIRVLIDQREARILPLSSATPDLSEIGFSGYGPYCGIHIEFKSIGGPLTDELDTEPRERILVNQDVLSDPLGDDESLMLIRLESGGVTTIRSQSGTVTFTRVSSTEVRGRFSAAAYRISGTEYPVEDDTVEGCFHIFGE